MIKSNQRVEENNYKLIEAVAEKIAQDILTSYKKIKKVRITIHKPQAPINGDFFRYCSYY